MRPVPCRISEIVRKKTVAVTFPNGDPLPEAAKRLKCGMYLDKETGKHVVAVRDGEQVFSSNETSDEGKEPNFLFIKNKRTNQVRLVPLQYYSLSLKSEEVVPEIVPEVNVYDKKMLGMKFGSKQEQRSLEHIRKMQTDKETLENKLKVISQNVEVDTSMLNDTVSNDDENRTYLPPVHRDASTVEEVYKLEDFLTENEQEILKEKAIDIMTNSDNYNKTQFSVFFWDSLQKLSKTDKDKVSGLIIILYIESIIRFLRITSKNLSAFQTKNSYISVKIKEKILKEFAVKTGNRWTRPLTMRDKALCYVMALALLVHDYYLELPSLASSLNMGVNRLLPFAKLVGAVEGSASTVILKVPLAPLPSDKAIKLSIKRKA